MGSQAEAAKATAERMSDIETLQATLERDREISGSAHAQLRSLVQSVVVHPVPAGAPLDIEITGYLANLLHAPQLPPNGRYRAGGTMVAEGGLEPPTFGL